MTPELAPQPASPPDPLAILAQSSALLALEDGWLDGAGSAPDGPGILWLAQALESGLPEGLPRPHLYPTESGGVTAEWTCGNVEASLEIDLAARAGIWAADDLERGVSEERRLDLTAPRSWEWLSARLRSAAELSAAPGRGPRSAKPDPRSGRRSG